MTRPVFTLTVMCSADGFIARAPDHPPQDWASPEEQVLFFRDVEAADWAIMGRNTHLAADRPDRRRIIFSTNTSGWIRSAQLWLNPAAYTPQDLPAFVAAVYPLGNGLILGGTTVHDWFLGHGGIHHVHLTIEPVTFGAGLPVFSDQDETDPVSIFTDRGFRVVSEQVLNAKGTRYLTLVPGENN